MWTVRFDLQIKTADGPEKNLTWVETVVSLRDVSERLSKAEVFVKESYDNNGDLVVGNAYIHFDGVYLEYAPIGY